MYDYLITLSGAAIGFADLRKKYFPLHNTVHCTFLLCKRLRNFIFRCLLHVFF